MASKMTPIVLEDVRIGFRNFVGAEGKFNRAGDRNFAAFLPADIAAQMLRDGWNVKHLNPRDEEEEPQAYLQVAVNFGGRPPRIVMITGKGKTSLGEEEVSLLDWAEIKHVDLILNPYEWEVSGKTGVKAYLQSLFVTIVEDELERKYMEVPDSASSSMASREEPVWND